MTDTITDIARLAALEAVLRLHTMTVARITSVHDGLIDCQPVVPRIVDGVPRQLPEFVDVPPITLQGGGSYIAMPIAAGDYCVLFFAERCLDAWWVGSDGAAPPSQRLHDYSDAVALVGVNPQAGIISTPATIKINGDTVQTGDATITGDEAVSGNVEAASYSVGGTPGFSGAAVDKFDRVITFVNGICTGVA